MEYNCKDLSVRQQRTLHHGTRCLQVAAEEGVDGGRNEVVVVQGEQNDVSLHLQDLLLVDASAVSDKRQFFQFWRIDFFVLLYRQQQRGDSHELQTRATNLLQLQEAIDNLHSNVQGLRDHLEFHVNCNLKSISIKNGSFICELLTSQSTKIIRILSLILS